ncbi:HeH/LEM domain protein, partial [Acinetobacter oleivorans]|uniref:HeH/LEM domain protein n=1 Tax=Acinetobacter oleivorans TaxID=1148157 RepID=UPI003AF8495D
MGLSAFNRMRERQMTEAKVTQLEEQLATLHGEFNSFQNDPEAMKERIAELESGNAGQKPEEDKKPGEDQTQPINYAGLKVKSVVQSQIVQAAIELEALPEATPDIAFLAQTK